MPECLLSLLFTKSLLARVPEKWLSRSDLLPSISEARDGLTRLMSEPSYCSVLSISASDPSSPGLKKVTGSLLSVGSGSELDSSKLSESSPSDNPLGKTYDCFLSVSSFFTKVCV